MISLKEFLEKSGCEKNLQKLMGEVIPEAVKLIRIAISSQKGELAGSENVYGEKQLALDIQANQIVLDVLKESGLVASAASEELENIVNFQPSTLFTVVFDPLDASSLVDVNFAVGSIFGIYPVGNLIGRTGLDQLAACYAVYGPHTTFVLTVKKGTHEFRLASDGNFYLTKENLNVEPQSKYFAPGNLRAAAEKEDYLKLVNGWIKNGLTLRYSGGMVPDINHILLKGSGVFTYPGYSKAPEGKLRLLFECNPFALLVEQAGGGASDGKQRILEKRITELHQRTPIFVGSKQTVQNACESLI
ncbi:fructose-1,6-bisphosphatase [Candidatus Peregrinibacteria bacterium]|nr:fructose-1,6-bisphosphatase [Candidatus Peregrinibacteria bacterium]